MKKTIRYLFIFMIFNMMFGQGSAQDNYPVSLQIADIVTYKHYSYDSSYADPDMRENTHWTVYEITEIYDEGNSTLIKCKSKSYSEKPTNDTEIDGQFLLVHGSGFFANISTNINNDHFEFGNVMPLNTKIRDFQVEIEQNFAHFGDGVEITYFDDNHGIEININVNANTKGKLIIRYSTTGILIHKLLEDTYVNEGIKYKSIFETILENSQSDFEGADEKSSRIVKTIPAFSGLTLTIFSLVGIFFLLSQPKIKQH
ncbi:hypothetical protein [Candidatus Lokiarchaeum ossiferum]|uniref:hypothetical protein n=1 Tax=Candidatus Lokiarchaeum ossiferum TaxID=2951803 RepID=UPI00352DC971